MKIPSWKHSLSYLFDFYITTINSEVNGPMRLKYSNGAFKLTTQKVIYSWGKHYLSYSSTFNKLNILEDSNIKNVLVLGWGMGSIATLLEKHPSVEKIVGIDYDKALNEFYNQEFKKDIPFEIQLFTSDALDFVNRCDLKFDLICSDIFDDNITPPKIISKEYLSGLNRLLNPGGKVLLSKLNRTTHDRKQNELLEENLKSLDIAVNSVISFGNSVYWWKNS